MIAPIALSGPGGDRPAVLGYLVTLIASGLVYAFGRRQWSRRAAVRLVGIELLVTVIYCCIFAVVIAIRIAGGPAET